MSNLPQQGEGTREQPRRPGPRPGGRRRRLRATLAAVAAVATLSVVLGVLIVRARRPEVRRPGEALPDITDRLSQDLPSEIPVARFVDVTAEVGLDGFRSFVGERTSQLPEDMGSGAAWGDFDNDGDDDLFVVAAGGSLDAPAERRAPSLLYENLGGRFEVVSDFPETRISGMGAAWADYDLDGWLDLVVTGFDTLRLFRNHQGKLVHNNALPDLEGFWAGAAWGDFDRDRDPDLYVCGYVDYHSDPEARQRVTQQYGSAVPYTLNPTSFEPARNLLFLNSGDGSFREAADEYGVANSQGRSLSALWHDLNADGWLDLYVANDISDNALFLNRGDVFEEVGLAAWVADYRGAMGLTAGDWNRDGDDDLFITHWVAQENALYDSRLSGQVDVVTFADADAATSLVPTFSDLSAPTGLGQIALPFVGWGTEFADFDGDGWLDLVVANGSTFEAEGEPKVLRPQPPFLLWNRRGEFFHDLAPTVPELREPRVGRGLALSDYDDDGDLDLLIVHLDGGVKLFRNDMQSGHWLQLDLRARQPSGVAGGDGATVTAWVGDVPLRRSQTGASYLSQSTRVLHFGLGEATAVDRVEIRWLGGARQSLGPLAADTRWRIVEGEEGAHRLLGPGVAVELTPEQRREFWSKQRTAMDLLKRESNPAAAIPLLQAALELDPDHEDSRYYLANALVAGGEAERGLEQLDEMRRRHPHSHRAHRQWGILRALNARRPRDLELAQAALQRSLELNPEETGSLLALGEVALLRGDRERARQQLEWACRSNPRAVGGFFLLAYLAWSQGDMERSRTLLRAAASARGEDWKPEGGAAEGEVLNQMHREMTPLFSYWSRWDGGSDDLEGVFAELDARLSPPR